MHGSIDNIFDFRGVKRSGTRTGTSKQNNSTTGTGDIEQANKAIQKQIQDIWYRQAKGYNKRYRR